MLLSIMTGPYGIFSTSFVVYPGKVRASRLVSLLLLLQTRGQLTAGELAGRLEVSERTIQRDVEALADAVWRGRRLSARYREGPKTVRRTLDPLGLVLKAGVWYLVARRSAGMRVYRVSRFASVRARDEGFERPPGFDLAEFWDEWSDRFERERPHFDARLRLRRVAVGYLRPLVHPDGRVALDAARRGPEREVIELMVPFERLDFAYRELLTFGRDVEVLDPPELRDRIRGAAEEVVALYR